MDNASQFTPVGAASMLSGHWFSPYIHRAVRFSPCVYTDASPGVESLVGRQFAQSLGARLLVSILRAVGAIFTFAIFLKIK